MSEQTRPTIETVREACWWAHGKTDDEIRAYLDLLTEAADYTVERTGPNTFTHTWTYRADG